MADVLNRTTKQYLQSVNTPDFDPADWIINPDLTAVAGQPVRYWLIAGDTVSLADQSTRDAIDAALAADREATQKESAKDEFDVERVLKALAELMVDEFNTLRQQFNTTTAEVVGATNTNFQDRTFDQLRTAIRNKIDAGAN